MMEVILEILIGASLLVGIMMIHGLGMFQVMHRFEQQWFTYVSEAREFKRQLFFGWLVSLMLLTHLIEVLTWAVALKIFHIIPDFRTAFYFAGETYTTVGFGDVVLPPEWRQLALFIAISGLFSFGWTTGVLVGMVSKTYEAHFSRLRKPK
jgi:hypothetical protein